MGTEVDVPDSQLPPSPVRQVHLTCGPSRTEAEHPQPRFGQVDFTKSLVMYNSPPDAAC